MPLTFAARHGKIETAKLLVENKATVDKARRVLSRFVSPVLLKGGQIRPQSAVGDACCVSNLMLFPLLGTPLASGARLALPST